MRLRYASPLSLPQVSPDDLQGATHASVCIEPPGSERSFVRHAPEFIDDPGGTGLFARLGAQGYTSPPAFVTVLQRATLFGYRSLAWDSWFCTDAAGTDPTQVESFLRKLASPDPFPNEGTGLTPAPDGDGFELDAAVRRQRHQEGAAVVLCSHEPTNYGSFLFRVMPKLHAMKALGLGHLPVVVWAPLPPLLELLRLAGVPGPQVIQHDAQSLTTFDRVFAPSLRNPSGFLDPESHAMFQRMAREYAAGGGGRRLYVSRLGHARLGRSSRVMLNEAELASALEARGFEVIEPETLSPAQQIAAFASADIVVGPAGSAMFNVVFCRPGTKVVDIESEPHWIYAHAGLFASCQARYGLFVGAVDATDDRPAHRRFSVDIPALLARIGRFEDS